MGSYLGLLELGRLGGKKMVIESQSGFGWAVLGWKMLLCVKCRSFLIAVVHLCLVDNAGAVSYGAFASRDVEKGQALGFCPAELGH